MTSRRPLLLVAVLALLAPAAARAQDWFARHGQDPIPVRLFSGTARDLDLLELDQGELEFRPVGESGAARVIVPLADAGQFRLQLLLKPEVATARERLGEGDLPGAIELLRPTVYPMVRFLEVPGELLPIHDLVRDFATALIAAGRLDEAVALVRRIPLDRVDAAFFGLALDTTRKLVDAGRSAEALAFLRGLPLGASQEEWFPRLFELAAGFRSADRLPEALAVYEKIAGVTGGAYTSRARLWSAYVLVRIGRADEARDVLGRTELPDRSRREYSLHQLVLARLALAAGDGAEALAAAAPGVVYSRIDDDWAAELRWITGRAYDEGGKAAVAARIYEEIDTFYPASPWAREARARLAEIRAASAPEPDPFSSTP